MIEFGKNRRYSIIQYCVPKSGLVSCEDLEHLIVANITVSEVSIPLCILWADLLGG
jgi:hypothetical protein